MRSFMIPLLFVACGLPQFLNAGILNDNFRMGINTYSFNYASSQTNQRRFNTQNLKAFDSLFLEYDSRFNLYAEGRVFFDNQNETTSLGVGYFVTPMVALGNLLIIDHNATSTQYNQATLGRSSATSLHFNPYARIFYKVVSRLNVDIRPGIILT